MFERLALSDYAIADLTIFNPNVYYKLGVRHALRPQNRGADVCAGQPRAPRYRKSARPTLCAQRLRKTLGAGSGATQ
jgi:hypothetical protein